MKERGIGIPGAVDGSVMLVSNTVNIGGKPFHIPETLGAYINVPIKAANDAGIYSAAGLILVGGING